MVILNYEFDVVISRLGRWVYETLDLDLQFIIHLKQVCVIPKYIWRAPTKTDKIANQGRIITNELNYNFLLKCVFQKNNIVYYIWCKVQFNSNPDTSGHGFLSMCNGINDYNVINTLYL